MKRKHLKRIAKYIAKRLERDVNWNMNLTLNKRADDPSYAGEWTSDDDGGKIGIESVEVTPRTSGYIAPSESFYTAATLPPKHVPFDKPSNVATPAELENNRKEWAQYAIANNEKGERYTQVRGELINKLADLIMPNLIDGMASQQNFILRKVDGEFQLELPLHQKHGGTYPFGEFKPSKKDNELRAVWSYADSMNTWSPPVIRLHGELVSWLAKRLDIDRLDDYEVKHTFTLRKREGVPHLDLPLTHEVKSDD